MAATFLLADAEPMMAQEAPPPGTVEVTGSAELLRPPDRVRIAFAVETEAETAEEAREENAVIMNRVRSAFDGNAEEGLRVETFGFHLQPRYSSPPRPGDAPPRIVGYRVVHHLQVLTDDPEAAGRLVDLGIGAGANRVSDIRFELRDADEARREALSEAVGRARGEAEAIASALGFDLGPPVEVRGGSDGLGFQTFRDTRALMAMEATPTPLEPELQRVSATVTIRYRLGDPR